jgi:hypothetical protein
MNRMGNARLIYMQLQNEGIERHRKTIKQGDEIETGLSVIRGGAKNNIILSQILIK